MQDQLISFETAKLARNKGFNESIEWYYYPVAFSLNNIPRLIADGAENRNETFYDGDNKEKSLALIKANTIEGFYSAPTQSLLAKWLREIHNIHIEIHSTVDSGWFYSVFNLSQMNNRIDLDTDFLMSYEEALEEVLFKVLRLI